MMSNHENSAVDKMILIMVAMMIMILLILMMLYSVDDNIDDDDDEINDDSYEMSLTCEKIGFKNFLPMILIADRVTSAFTPATASALPKPEPPLPRRSTTTKRGTTARSCSNKIPCK